ncbi:MAG: isoprenylcysteine carboxylmethyltransferase family protein [Chloroflexota bacterium]
MSNQRRWRGERGEWYVILQFFLFALIAFGPESTEWLPSWEGRIRTVSQLFGLLFAGCGLLLLAAGTLHLGSNLTALPHPKDDAKLVTHGAYRFVRHPIYSGILLGALGWSLWKGSPLMLIYSGILLLFFDIKSRKEEQWLTNKFDQYEQYQSKVPKLLPFVY